MHTVKHLILALPLLLGACAHNLVSEDAALQWHPIVSRGELTNGLRYNLIPVHQDKGRLDVRMTVRGGSVDETDDQVGIAHLLEHLSFYSHGSQPANIRQRLQAAGWQQARHFNAMTTYDRTQYQYSPPNGTAGSELALRTLADQLFAGDYNAADLQRERPIVIEEWRGGLGVAQRMNGKRTTAQRSGSRYPAHRPIGTLRAIEAAQVETLKAFQQRWYRPGNMVLNIVGDFEPQAMARQIEQAFGQVAAASVGERPQLELPLDDTLKVFRVQDSQSGANQVALMLRFHQLDRRVQTAQASRERLIDRLALAALSRQLRRQPLNASVASLTATSTQIGRRSALLAVAASVNGERHEQALYSLLRELQRVRRHPLYEADVAAVKQEVQRIAERMLSEPVERGFDDWVRQLNDATLSERVLQDPEVIARNTLDNLAGISAAEIKQRIDGWLDSRDRVLQLSAPGGSPLALPEPAQVEAQWQRLTTTALSAPVAAAPPVAQATAELQAIAPPGQILSRQHFGKEQVEHWQLSNGDRLVWLRQPGASGKAQLRVDSPAGFAYQGGLPWRAQIASQLALNTPLPGQDEAGLKAWQQAHAVQLSFSQSARRLEASGRADNATLAELFTLYQLRQLRMTLDPEDYADSLADLHARLERHRDRISNQQSDTWRQLRDGQDDWQEPTPADLEQLSRAQLQRDWQRQAAAPVTYYLMSDLPAAQVEALVTRYLAGIPRGETLYSAPATRQPGQRQAQLRIAVEPRAALYAASFQPHPWNPADAVRVASLREIARAQLKQQLRSEASGVYRLRFDSELSPEHGRIDSELHFNSDPQRAAELWQLALHTLDALPAQIDEARLQPLRAELQRQEALRRHDPDTQLHRLILSERAWGDPRYLSGQQTLPEALQVAPMQRLARQLFAPANRVRLLVLPAAETAP